jgi:hypothetical protein
MKEDFKDFRNKQDTVSTKEIIEKDPEVKNILKKFITERTTLSDGGLVTLVILSTTGTLNNESYRKELEMFEYIKENKLTESGEKYINDEKNINRLKKLIED